MPLALSGRERGKKGVKGREREDSKGRASVGKQRCGDITVAGIRQQHHDGLTIQDELDKITGLLPAKTESQTVNEEVSNLESINKQAETLGYYFEYDNRENIVDIYENESGNLIGSLDSEGNFGFTDDFEGQLPDEVSQLASRFLVLSKTSQTEEHEAEKEAPIGSENKNPLSIPEDEVRKIYKEAYPKNQERAAKEMI